MGPFGKLGKFLIAIFNQYKWRIIAAVLFEDLVWEDAGESITRVLKDQNVDLVVVESYKGEPSEAFMDKVLERIKTRARST